MKNWTSSNIAVFLLTLVAGSTLAISFATVRQIKASSEDLRLQQQEQTEQARVIACRRQRGTRGPCEPPTPWS